MISRINILQKYMDTNMSANDYIPEDVNGLRRSKEDALDILNQAYLYAFKDKLKRQRKSLKLKQSDLAESVGLKQPAISRIENHENKSLSLTTLQEIAMGLDCVLTIDLVPRAQLLDKIKDENDG